VLRIGPNSVERRYGHKDQFAAQISAFSGAIRHGDEIGPSGEEGLRDVRVLRALVESHAAGRRVDLPKLSHPIRAAC
jgi:glucose-fructose oxidoreductase